MAAEKAAVRQFVQHPDPFRHQQKNNTRSRQEDKRQITPRCTATRQSRALVCSVVPVSCRAVPNQSHFDDCK